MHGTKMDETDGRKCWQTARERDRSKARFQIRERVASLSIPVDEICDADDDDAAGTGTGGSGIVPSKQDGNLALQTDFVMKCVRYIQQGDRSKFSLSTLDRNICTLSGRIPTSFVANHASAQSIQLCLAWFGKEYSEALSLYWECLDTFTMLEYSVWMGKYSIAGSLLIGGVNPCIRSTYKDNIDLGGGCTNGTSDVAMWQRRLALMGGRVIQRFFNCFPILLSSYIVKRVVDLRREAHASSCVGMVPVGVKKLGGNDTDDDDGSCLSQYCPLCQSEAVPLGFQVKFSQCQHALCEVCLWESLLENIDQHDGFDDVVVCPICQHALVPEGDYSALDQGSSSSSSSMLVAQNTLARHQLAQKGTSFMRSKQRRSESMLKFLDLPLNKNDPKLRMRKKKKVPELGHIAPSWDLAVAPSLGITQDVRMDKFFTFVDKNAIHYVRGCLVAGVDVDRANEYGQTALYVSAWKGYSDLVGLLLSYGADPAKFAHGGSTVSQICSFLSRDNILTILREHGVNVQPEGCSRLDLTALADFTPPVLTTLIPVAATDHPGAGSYQLENMLSPSQVGHLLTLFGKIPVAKQKEKSSLCSQRSYFCDSEGRVCELIENAIQSSFSCHRRERRVSVHAFPHMRFLNYETEGTSLPPHVDLSRVDPYSGKRSTHTFILYLTDCQRGGGTSLLGDVAGPGRSKILAYVTPRQGRLLIFPHACPHEGNEVYDTPKILLRGEIMLSGQVL